LHVINSLNFFSGDEHSFAINGYSFVRRGGIIWPANTIIASGSVIGEQVMLV
jgi:hypothetical protein